MPTCSSTTRKRRTARFWKKASPKRVDGVVHRGRHGLRQLRRADDSVLHLLLDVRIPARRRPDLGVRRCARQGLPDGRHGRPHHAAGRRIAAPGRPQPGAGQHRSHLRGLRSGLRLRDRGDRSGRHPPHVSGDGRPLLLPDALQRKLRHAGDAGRRGGGHSARASTSSSRPRRARRRCSCSAAVRS